MLPSSPLVKVRARCCGQLNLAEEQAVGCCRPLGLGPCATRSHKTTGADRSESPGFRWRRKLKFCSLLMDPGPWSCHLPRWTTELREKKVCCLFLFRCVSISAFVCLLLGGNSGINKEHTFCIFLCFKIRFAAILCFD